MPWQLEISDPSRSPTTQSVPDEVRREARRERDRAGVAREDAAEGIPRIGDPDVEACGSKAIRELGRPARGGRRTTRRDDKN
jgi:hypothetical protein